MNVTIDLSEQTAAVLIAQALAAHMRPETYLRELVSRALLVDSSNQITPEQMTEQLRKPKKSAYGVLAKYGTGPTEAEIDENRKEMLSGFGELAP